MSGVLVNAVTSEVALTAATAKTVLQIVAAANHRVKVLGWGVFFDGISTTAEPVLVDVLRQTTAGTMSALTPTKVNSSDDETIQLTAQHTAIAEPTAGDIIDGVEIHPQQGYQIMLPLGQEFIVPGGTRLGIRCNAPANVNVRAKFFTEE